MAKVSEDRKKAGQGAGSGRAGRGWSTRPERIKDFLTQ
jgi:hypothetical protein